MSRAGEAFEAAAYGLMKRMPVEWASATGSFIVRNNVRFFLKHIAEGARRNLRIHNPQISARDLERSVTRFLDNVGRMMGEFAILHRLQDEGRLSYDSGFERIKAEDGTTPLVAIALHIGNWEAMGAGLKHLGIETATFYEPPESPVQRRIAVETRQRLGFRLLSPNAQGLRDALSVLRSNGNVIIFGDEARGGRTMAPLFGRPPHEHGNLAIAARLARKTHARLVISYVERLPRCHFRLHMGEPFRLPDPHGSVIEDVAFLNARIEPVILDHLDSWYFLDDLIEPLPE